MASNPTNAITRVVSLNFTIVLLFNLVSDRHRPLSLSENFPFTKPYTVGD